MTDRAFRRASTLRWASRQSVSDGQRRAGPRGELPIPEKFGSLDPAQMAEAKARGLVTRITRIDYVESRISRVTNCRYI